MNNIDELLKSARPEVPELPKDFSNSIISKIKDQGLEIAPQKVGRPGMNGFNFMMGLLFLAVASINTNNAIFEVQMGGSLELLFFGAQYAVDVARYLPLDIILSTLLLTGAAAWLLWRSKMIKRGIALIVAGSYLATSIGGTALAATSMNQQIQSHIINRQADIPVISWFYKERARYHMVHPEFKMGQVLSQEDGLTLIQDPRGNIQKVYLLDSMSVDQGQFIRLNGEEAEDGFHVNHMQHCDTMRAGRYFSHMEMMMKNGMMDGNKMMNRGMMNGMRHRMNHGEDDQ